ncbi:CCHC-type domain-containing protein [Nephila pilipes]|uniref:CCHC-type domain-containing protein n=1 Tax=Nephila pilipes TaxID=299642 RepID=A0A8X6N585_NEPPI|nr:CCHC-type domain-containing protein [Nephila pilipes]
MNLNNIFLECNRRLQDLTTLEEDIKAYDCVLEPKILRAFPDDVCRRLIIHANGKNITEGEITKLQQFLSEEFEGDQVRGFESPLIETQPLKRVELQLISNCNKSSVCLSALESSNTQASHQTVRMDITLFNHQKKLKLTDPYKDVNDLPIEVLIGADFYVL